MGVCDVVADLVKDVSKDGTSETHAAAGVDGRMVAVWELLRAVRGP